MISPWSLLGLESSEMASPGGFDACGRFKRRDDYQHLGAALHWDSGIDSDQASLLRRGPSIGLRFWLGPGSLRSERCFRSHR